MIDNMFIRWLALSKVTRGYQQYITSAYNPPLMAMDINDLECLEEQYRTMKPTATQTYLANQIEPGDCLDQSRNIYSHRRSRV